jgi:hypothetical protein
VFGDTITFCAPVSIMPLWSSPLTTELDIGTLLGTVILSSQQYEVHVPHPMR